MTPSFPTTRRAVTAGAAGVALSAQRVNRGAHAFAVASLGAIAVLARSTARSTEIKTLDLAGELNRRNYSNDKIRVVPGGYFRRLLAQFWG